MQALEGSSDGQHDWARTTHSGDTCIEYVAARFGHPGVSGSIWGVKQNKKLSFNVYLKLKKFKQANKKVMEE